MKSGRLDHVQKLLNWTEIDDQLIIELPKEFDYKTNLNFLKRQRDNFLYHIKDEKITRIINIDDKKFLVQIRSYENTHFKVQILLSPTSITTEEKYLIVQFITNWFDLERDLAPFYKMAKRDSLLQQLINKNYGLRNIGIPDLFEALCWAVIGQQVNLSFAATLKREFIKSFGESVNYHDTYYWSFPSYKKIASLSKEHMSHIKMTERKKEYIIGIANEMANSQLTKQKLHRLNKPRQIEKELTKIRGIGPWTAHYVLMRCLRYPTAFPVDDVGLINAIQHVKNLEQKPTRQQILKLFERWKNWEGYVAFYMWQSLY